MQENPILSVMKLAVLATFTIFLGLNFFQYQSLEIKVIKTREKVDDMVSATAELGRKVDKLAESGIAIGPGDSSGGGTTRRVDADFEGLEEDRKSDPSTIRGMTLYPFNTGWTVVADKRANEDRTKFLPNVDKIVTIAAVGEQSTCSAGASVAVIEVAPAIALGAIAASLAVMPILTMPLAAPSTGLGAGLVISGLVLMAVALALIGTASRTTLSRLGAIRMCLQGVAGVSAVALGLASVVLCAGTMSLDAIVTSQASSAAR